MPSPCHGGTIVKSRHDGFPPHQVFGKTLDGSVVEKCAFGRDDYTRLCQESRKFNGSEDEIYGGICVEGQGVMLGLGAE
jgi:hypothetical protein